MAWHSQHSTAQHGTARHSGVRVFCTAWTSASSSISSSSNRRLLYSLDLRAWTSASSSSSSSSSNRRISGSCRLYARTGSGVGVALGVAPTGCFVGHCEGVPAWRCRVNNHPIERLSATPPLPHVTPVSIQNSHKLVKCGAARRSDQVKTRNCGSSPPSSATWFTLRSRCGTQMRENDGVSLASKARVCR